MSRLLIRLASNQFSPVAASYHRCLIIGRALATNATNSKATPEQLHHVEHQLEQHLPKFFSGSHPYNLYCKDLTFIDNIRNIRTHGIRNYIIQVLLIRAYFNLRYTNTKVELLNLVKNPEESYVRIRWRVETRPGLFKTYYFLVTDYKKLKQWHDGISTFHVNEEGKIHCHVCDNIDVESDDIEAKDKSSIKNPLVNRGLSVCDKPRV